MIRTESEYQQAAARVDAERARLAAHLKAWKKQGFTAQQVAKLREPLEAFHMQLAEEVASYERLKRGRFDEFENLHGLGQTLIGLRIARGMTQRELARRLEVDETAVSRDERNEYHGITVDRARKVLEALGVRLVTRVEVEPLRAAGERLARPRRTARKKPR
jgi:ribosome-binding protein aMBF1 (putative translation factor)